MTSKKEMLKKLEKERQRVAKLGHVPPKTIGRPSDYDPKYCQELINHMAQGLSFETFGAVIDVCGDTLDEWVKVHPAFSGAKKKGRLKSRLEWEKVGGLQSLKDRDFNTTLWYMNMKNRHGWKDNHEHTHDIKAEITTDKTKLEEIKKKIKASFKEKK